MRFVSTPAGIGEQTTIRAQGYPASGLMRQFVP
jgi:hypothetical protein